MERFALDDRDTTLKRLGTGKVTLADISEAFAKPDSESDSTKPKRKGAKA
jgi:hypothetical protein